ncbi:MAG: hypothetical protein CFH10_01948 [Alphaproteobacteria bacterium MarineAlpha4_Bin2]|nr:MAG: hypothetical protein CFH10_01948 [Alphaproteobacteria bacterium MarineAlpha4_Bin2]
MSREAVIARRVEIRIESQNSECLLGWYPYLIEVIQRAFETMCREYRSYDNPTEVKGPVSVRG